MIPALRHFWWDKAEGEPGRFTNFVLTNHWQVFDPTGGATGWRVAGVGDGQPVSGVGVADPRIPEPVRGDPHQPTTSGTGPGWLHLLDQDWEQVLVYEATVHDGWLPHSRHDLAAPTRRPGHGRAALGDAATPAGHAHRWPVWLVAANHALILTPTSHEPAHDRVTLPRPPAGRWAADPPVQVLTADQVAQACAALADGFTTLTRGGPPNPPSST